MVETTEVTAVTGKGLEGDGYFKGIGHFFHRQWGIDR